jgi:hypothetical protein
MCAKNMMMASQDKGVTHLKPKDFFFSFLTSTKVPLKTTGPEQARKTVHCTMRYTDFTEDSLYFQNNIWFYTTHIDVISLYTHINSTAFPVPIITKLINTLKNYTHISHTEFDPNHTINVDGNDRNPVIQGVRKRLYHLQKFFFGPLLFGGRHLENFLPTGTAGISIKSRSI